MDRTSHPWLQELVVCASMKKELVVHVKVGFRTSQCIACAERGKSGSNGWRCSKMPRRGWPPARSRRGIHHADGQSMGREATVKGANGAGTSMVAGGSTVAGGKGSAMVGAMEGEAACAMEGEGADAMEGEGFKLLTDNGWSAMYGNGAMLRAGEMNGARRVSPSAVVSHCVL